ncbi:hypothetical protein Hypma_000008 [Hypsizygus marmoreus]|uniref:DUF6830 domain-containing protein n=1 Tax=Hypsizygus marmoreus TaxID=39966 RepID=A0A369K932_HYPMA|nr:hypothetical protein Hypma_000008 [Hypsizygus marmoreus]
MDIVLEGDNVDFHADHGLSNIEYFEGAAEVHGTGTTFMDQFDLDEYASERVDNLFYPFASRDEWELSSFLLRSGLSMASINKFLTLKLIQRLGLSFRTAQQLRNRAELLPKGPEWNCKPWKTTFPTKSKVSLFYRDPIDCIQSLLHHPLMKDHINFTPFRMFKTAERMMRIYTEWLSGNVAWEMQEQLPPGATLLGTVLSSDKTNISAMTGGRTAHPLLISLANLDMTFRMKANNHAFLLLALLPIPKFIHKDRKTRGVLENRLIHECLDFVLQPLKTAAQVGIMMSDALGGLRYAFTPLAAYIVDTQESTMLAGVNNKASSVTMASYKQLGDAFPHEPRTALKTIAQLQVIEKTTNPWHLDAYIKEANKVHLNSVHRLFYRDWALSDPSQFLTPEPLHHWHKMFWDHEARWSINAVGGAEIDFRFSLLHPHTAFRHFHEGISKLKQVTGREHCDIQRYIIPVIAGTVSSSFLIAIRSLIDFRYLGQAPEIDDSICAKIENALATFHRHKKAIIMAGARTGKGGRVIDNWYIPKLEFMQSVVSSIRKNGVAIQWSADAMEHAHITEIKEPTQCTNNQNYESQICRHLDRADKCCRFDLATATREARLDIRDFTREEQDDDDGLEDGESLTVNTTVDLLSNITPVSQLTGTTCHNADYFAIANMLQQDASIKAPFLLRTFVGGDTAIHLSRDPSFKRMSIHDVAVKFKLPNLHLALADYLNCVKNSDGTILTDDEPPTQNIRTHLPFDMLEIWTKVRIQNRAYFAPHDILPAQTINTSPPSDSWPFGHSDTVLMNTDPNFSWPRGGLEGHVVGQLQLIFRAVPQKGAAPTPGTDMFLAYIQRYDVIPQINREISGSSTRKGAYPHPASGMFLMQRARHEDDSLINGIVPLARIRTLVELTPDFGETADIHLTKETTLNYCSQFWLNKYLDKESYYAMSLL